MNGASPADYGSLRHHLVVRGPLLPLVALLLCLALVACTSSQVTPSPTSGGSPPSASPTSLVPAPTGGPSAVPTTTPAPPTPPPPTSPTTPPPAPSTPTAVPAGQFDPESIRLTVESFASGFTPLTFVTHAGDGSGRLFAVEQRGVIWPLDAQGNVAPTPFLDIRDRVRAGGERGLLGLAFHPDFESNGRFFVNYTNGAGNTVVSEFTWQPDPIGGVGSERVLLRINQPYPNHNGGMLAFDRNGLLYIATGDGGSGGDPHRNGQSLATLLGKMLRIDVDSGDPFAIPAANPFAGGERPEIWSFGLRNPWRFSFDRTSGAMFIGDVGQGASEEIDAEPADVGGRNYGWNIMEGDRCYERNDCDRRGLTLPVASYARADGNCAVTGGYVYRGAQFPALFGGYVYSDYCGGGLWAFNADTAVRNGDARVFQLGQTQLRVTSFGEDEAGEIYVVHQAGEIYRLVATPR